MEFPMEQTKICQRSSHRYPEALFYYDDDDGNEKIIAATDASEKGAFFQNNPEKIKSLKTIKFSVNGKTYYALKPEGGGGKMEELDMW
jgi:hypothetical protein